MADEGGGGASPVFDPFSGEYALAPLDRAGSFDAVADFSDPFPVEVICRKLGVPEGERQQIRQGLDLALVRRPGRMDPTPEGVEPAVASRSYVLELTMEERHRPSWGRDGDQAAGQHGGAVPPVPGPVGLGGRRPWDDPVHRRGGPALPAPPRCTGVGSRSATRSTSGSPSPPVTRPSWSPGRPPGTSGRSTGPTCPISGACRPGPSPSASASGSTPASGRRWPAWRAGWPSPPPPAVGPGWPRTRRPAHGSGCPTWPAPLGSRSTAGPDPRHRQVPACPGIVPVGRGRSVTDAR